MDRAFLQKMTLSGQQNGVIRLVASVESAQRVPSDFKMILWGELLPHHVPETAGGFREAWPLDALSDDEVQRLLDSYHDLIARIGLASKPNDIWWYSWSSSRDRFHSRILSDLELLARLGKACDQTLPQRLVLLCPDPYLADALVHAAHEHGVRLKRSSWDRFLWRRNRVEMRLRPVMAAIKICGRAWLSKWRMRKIHPYLDDSPRAKMLTLLVTWIKGKNLLENDLPTDTYFGRLPAHLSNPDHAVVVFGDTSDGLPPKEAAQHNGISQGALTVGSFVTTLGIIKAFVRALSSGPPLGQAMADEQPYLRRLVKRDIQANMSPIVYGLILEHALTNLVGQLRPTRLMHMCENNPWERACAQAVRSVTPQPELIGYMHCAVLPSHTKIIITDEEKEVRPRPSLVICTGDRARDILVRVGGHSPEEVVAGCALRQEYLSGVPCRSNLRRPIKNVLVVLEALPNMCNVVKFVHQALDGVDDIKTIIRPHPTYPFRRTLAEAGLSLSDFTTITVSDQGSLLEEFDRTDLVIYKGSTSAMEAGYIGIPLVHIKLPNLLTDDPLFEVPYLKQVVETPEELVPAIRKISLMDDQEFTQQHTALRGYIEEYLTMPDENSMQAFFPQVFTGVN